jgi:hypothetical protein
MTAREAETARRRRRRREEREAAWREWAAGGELTEQPVSWPEDIEPKTIEAIALCIAAENLNIGLQFAKECWLVEREHWLMRAGLMQLIAPWAYNKSYTITVPTLKVIESGKTTPASAEEWTWTG